MLYFEDTIKKEDDERYLSMVATMEADYEKLSEEERNS